MQILAWKKATESTTGSESCTTYAATENFTWSGKRLSYPAHTIILADVNKDGRKWKEAGGFGCRQGDQISRIGRFLHVSIDILALLFCIFIIVLEMRWGFVWYELGDDFGLETVHKSIHFRHERKHPKIAWEFELQDSPSQAFVEGKLDKRWKGEGKRWRFN